MNLQAVPALPLGTPRPEAPIPGPPSPGVKDELHEAALAFESLLMSMLLQNLRKTVEPAGLLGNSGQARGTLEYLMDQAVVDKAVRGGKGWGLASKLEEAWRRRAEAGQPGNSPRA
ncbi:MAG: hypothetical protein HY823_01605 [Acidobacteria bacterium]|nr:hypothetical protein [Acidobacteriota bacterium]